MLILRSFFPLSPLQHSDLLLGSLDRTRKDFFDGFGLAICFGFFGGGQVGAGQVVRVVGVVIDDFICEGCLVHFKYKRS